MKIQQLINDLRRFQAEGRQDVHFGKDEEINDEFRQPIYQTFQDEKRLLILTPNQSTRVE
jgi:hypothetical protein